MEALELMFVFVIGLPINVYICLDVFELMFVLIHMCFDQCLYSSECFRIDVCSPYAQIHVVKTLTGF